MKILNTLSNLIVEDSIPFEEKVLNSNSYEDIADMMKLFNHDLHQLYKYFDRKGMGEKLLERISYYWPWDDSPLMHVINALGGMNKWRRGMFDTDLLDIYVHQPYIEDIPNLKYDKDRIILELLEGEEARLFGGSNYNADDCKYIAKQIFGEDGLEWEPYDVDERLEDLIDLLSPENYIKLVRHIGIEFQNEEVDAWREEFDEVREDNGKVIITPRFMNGFLTDNDSIRYTLAVLIGNTPELADLEIEIKDAYRRAWNEVVINQYYDEYRDALEEFLGKPIGHGTTYTYPKHGTNASSSQYKKVEVPVKYFDVTDLARVIITRHAYDMDSPQDFLDMLDEYEETRICPSVDDYPYDEEEVKNLFQDYIWDYL
jgi:hypothetical protein